jgi:hypothetical protein
MAGFFLPARYAIVRLPQCCGETLGENFMATITLTVQDLDIEVEEISLNAWEAPAMLEANSIDPEDLHGEWSALDDYIRKESFNFDRVAEWIAEGDLSDGQLSDLAYRIARELVSRLHNVRKCADQYLETNRQNVERIRELDRAAAPDAATA